MKSKILKISGITLLVLVTFVWSAPWLFKGKITTLVKAQINKDLRPMYNFSGRGYFLFRQFSKNYDSTG